MSVAFSDRPTPAGITIRPERPTDAPAVADLLEQAFGGTGEVNLVAALHRHDAVTVALVALVNEQVVGHILFSPVTLEVDPAYANAIALAPLAVLPGCRRQGIGGRLIQAGLAACREAGYALVVVLGHPDYYPAYGFQPAKRYGLALCVRSSRP
ncbi:MAG: GNAT family N-acetyltransferase [Chloroflexaceae bacterium]